MVALGQNDLMIAKILIAVVPNPAARVSWMGTHEPLKPFLTVALFDLFVGITLRYFPESKP